MSTRTSMLRAAIGAMGKTNSGALDRRSILLAGGTLAAVTATAGLGMAQTTNAVAQTHNPGELNRQTLEQRAVTAAIWGMPIVSVNAMRRAFFRDAKANYNDVVFLSTPADWKFQTTTPNITTRYVYFNFNTKEGPVVVEIPPAVEAGLFGSLLDAWQVPLADVGPAGEDQGKGGKYLVLPPDFSGNPPAGYTIVRAQTYNGYSLLRAIPKSSSEADVNNAIALIKKLRLYPLANADHRPE